MTEIRPALNEKYYDYEGCRIRYIDEGNGPPIVFLHGLGGSIEDNSACFPYLYDNWRVISFDYPGSGYSDKPDIEYSVESVRDFTIDFTTRLGLDKFYLAGGSQGGLQVLLFCERASERVIKAAVYSPAGVWPARPAMAKIVRSFPPGAVWLFFRISSLMWYSPEFPHRAEERRKSLEFIDSREQPGFARHVFGCMASQIGRDFRPLFAEIETQTLIIWGTHDFGMPHRMGRELNGIMKNSELIIVPRTGHNVPKEKPEFFAEKITEFFNR